MTGKTIAHYEVGEKIGAGGMGVVYQATDTKLNRQVALKVLPEEFAKDSARMARFRREAQLLASLNHPNIAAIYGLEQEGDTQAIAMELVDGLTLAERIKQGAIPLDESLNIAKQIAEALESAHEQGVIHRDLKPANVKVKDDRQVKVLDFGLAKALEDPQSNPDMSNSPTLSVAATRAGIIIGTAAYMSPEQARGQATDKRADIWSFGVVLFEMLTGRQVFEGETISDILAAVLRAETDFDALPKSMPRSIRNLLVRCLTKDRKQRLRDIGEARIVIDRYLADPSSSAAELSDGGDGAMSPMKRWLPWGVAALAGLTAVTAFAFMWRGDSPSPTPVGTFEFKLPDDIVLNLIDEPALAISPDGNRIAFMARREGGESQLFIRQRDRLNVQPVPGTENGTSPFFSPDGEQLAFFSDGHLRKVHLNNQTVTTLAPGPQPRGGVWLPDDTIVFSGSYLAGLSRISANGGSIEEIAVPDNEKGERSYRWPAILPGGHVILFTIGTIDSPNNYDNSPIAAIDLNTGEQKIILDGGYGVRYAPSGHLVFGREGKLFAVPFDVDSLETRGAPIPLFEKVGHDPSSGTIYASLADDGTLVYLPAGGRALNSELVLVDRSGRETTLPVPPQPYHYPRFSPDGTRLAVTIGLGTGLDDIWVYHLQRETMTRLTFDTGSLLPIWSPDGTRLAYSTGAVDGNEGIRIVAADGSGALKSIMGRDRLPHAPSSWTARDSTIALTLIGLDPDIFVVSTEGDSEPEPFAAEPVVVESNPSFSPEGNWIAYASNESGREEIYVRPYPGPGGKFQISTEGGQDPVWSANGKSIYFLETTSSAGTSVHIVPVSAEGSFQAGKPRRIHTGEYERSQNWYSNWDVAPDGKHFVFVKLVGDQQKPRTVRVTLNWLEELRRIAPAN